MSFDFGDLEMFYEIYHFSIDFGWYCVSFILGAILFLAKLYIEDRNGEKEESSNFEKFHFVLTIFFLMFGLCGVLLDTEAYMLKWKSRFWCSLTVGLATCIAFFKVLSKSEKQS
jgi:hypothetical protein